MSLTVIISIYSHIIELYIILLEISVEPLNFDLGGALITYISEYYENM